MPGQFGFRFVWVFGQLCKSHLIKRATLNQHAQHFIYKYNYAVALSFYITISLSLSLVSPFSNTKLSANTISSALSSHGYGSNGYANGNSSTPTPAPVSPAHLPHTPLTLSACAKTILSDTHANTHTHTQMQRAQAAPEIASYALSALLLLFPLLLLLGYSPFHTVLVFTINFIILLAKCLHKFDGSSIACRRRRDLRSFQTPPYAKIQEIILARRRTRRRSRRNENL